MNSVAVSIPLFSTLIFSAPTGRAGPHSFELLPTGEAAPHIFGKGVISTPGDEAGGFSAQMAVNSTSRR